MDTIMGSQKFNSTGNLKITLSEKVNFLKQSINYPDTTSSVQAIETHFSWVFLTDRFAYKLKKPISSGPMDLRTVDARKANCQTEVNLNARLANGVYLGIIPLSINKNGCFTLSSEIHPVDWLVKMKKLPEDAFLSNQIMAGQVDWGILKTAAANLIRFFNDAPPVITNSREFLFRLKNRLEGYHEELASYNELVDQKLLKNISNEQFSFISKYPWWFQERVDEGKIIDAHGDLRPEHVSLIDPPVFIDCLDFDSDLRTQDPIEDIALLALESDIMGAPAIGSLFYETYLENEYDEKKIALINFYKSFKAVIKALLSIRHIREPEYSNDSRWKQKTSKYLEYARNYIKHREK